MTQTTDEEDRRWGGWHDNRRAAQGTVKGGKSTGHWVHWYENGQRGGEGTYIDADQREGRWVAWYKDGRLNIQRTGLYKNDQKP